MRRTKGERKKTKRKNPVPPRSSIRPSTTARFRFSPSSPSKSVNALGRNGIASDGKQLESGGGGGRGKVAGMVSRARANIRGIEWPHCPGGADRAPLLGSIDRASGGRVIE